MGGPLIASYMRNAAVAHLSLMRLALARYSNNSDIENICAGSLLGRSAGHIRTSRESAANVSLT